MRRALDEVHWLLKRSRKRKYEPGRRLGWLGVRYMLKADALLDAVLATVEYV